MLRSTLLRFSLSLKFCAGMISSTSKCSAENDKVEFCNPRWDQMWKNGITPGELFDKGAASPALIQLINNKSIPNGRCLVPGCGRAYDLAALASPYRSVLGIDISQAAVDNARVWLSEQSIPSEADVQVKLLNFFDIKPESIEEKFDFVYDYTFLCALDPSIRVDWAKQMSEIIKPNGLLVTLIYPILEKEGGPPFKVSLELIKSLLEPVGFEQLELAMLPPELCHPGREQTSGIGRWKKL